MVNTELTGVVASDLHLPVQVIRHAQVCKKLQVSSAKLFDMIARSQFPKPFRLIPGGRAVGWLEQDIDRWIIDRKDSVMQEGA
jgi:predicted DNA-binding transcriptional regulator AlpA